MTTVVVLYYGTAVIELISETAPNLRILIFGDSPEGDTRCIIQLYCTSNPLSGVNESAELIGENRQHPFSIISVVTVLDTGSLETEDRNAPFSHDAAA